MSRRKPGDCDQVEDSLAGRYERRGCRCVRDGRLDAIDRELGHVSCELEGAVFEIVADVTLRRDIHAGVVE